MFTGFWEWHCEVKDAGIVHWLSELHRHSQERRSKHAPILHTRGVGSRTGRLLLEFSLKCNSSLMFQAFRSLLTLSFHLNFGLPIGRFPSIFISTTALMLSVSSLLFLLTCPNHSSLLLLITITIGSTFASSKISSFSGVPMGPHPLHHSHLLLPYAFHLWLTLAMFRTRKATSVESLSGISGASFSLELSCRKSIQSYISISTMPLPLCSPRLCWLLLFCLSLILDIWRTGLLASWQFLSPCISSSY